MELLQLGKSDLISSRLIYGCMRITGDNSAADHSKGTAAIHAAIEAGYNHFDHADIYDEGRCEELFAEVLKEDPAIRDKIILTSKCGIIKKGMPTDYDPGRYDFSKEHIIKSVEGSLKRLGTEFLDLLLLHRPDYLFDSEDVNEAFEDLHKSGKVLNFGVSNFHPSQLTLLQSSCTRPLIVNQLEFNIHNIAIMTDGSLDQCQMHQISPMAWCPLGGVVYPAWGNIFSEEDECRIKKEFDLQAEKYGTENWLIMLAWILRHPAKIFPIIGSTNPGRIRMALRALDLDYSREDWYRLLEARNGQPVP